MKGISDAYKLYCTSVKEPVDIHTYRNLTCSFVEFIILKLAEGKILRLPEGLGDLHFAGKKVMPTLDEDGNIKNLSVDWKETQKNWKNNPIANENKTFIYHFNEHTYGIRYKFYWKKRYCVVKNKNFYLFIPARALKRRFAQIIFKEETEFIVR